MRLPTIAAVAALSIAGPAKAQDPQACEALTSHYSTYDTAAVYFDRVSRGETSTLRADTAQSALTNILLRQGMVLNMMIARACELPPPPEFPMMGLIRSHN